MPETKYCSFCGEKIIRSASNFHDDHLHYFCNSHCDAMYKRKLADEKNFKRVDNYNELLKEHKRKILYSVKYMSKYIFSKQDLDDFIQVCRIELWKLYSNRDWENSVTNKSSYIISSFINAIRRYIQELSRTSEHHSDIDAIYFANPESQAYYRECLNAIDMSSYKELLASILCNKTTEELAERFNTTKQGFILRCCRQRQRLEDVLIYDKK